LIFLIKKPDPGEDDQKFRRLENKNDQQRSLRLQRPKKDYQSIIRRPWRNLENNALSSCINCYKVSVCVGDGVATFSLQPTSRFRNNLCKDDSALFSRFLHAGDHIYEDMCRPKDEEKMTNAIGQGTEVEEKDGEGQKARTRG
jgi:hypothetical protein